MRTFYKYFNSFLRIFLDSYLRRLVLTYAWWISLSMHLRRSENFFEHLFNCNMLAMLTETLFERNQRIFEGKSKVWIEHFECFDLAKFKGTQWCSISKLFKHYSSCLICQIEIVLFSPYILSVLLLFFLFYLEGVFILEQFWSMKSSYLV